MTSPPVLLCEEFDKPFFFLNKSQDELRQVLSNAPPLSAVIRNLNRYDVRRSKVIADGDTANKIMLEAVFVSGENSSVGSRVILKKRKGKETAANVAERLHLDYASSLSSSSSSSPAALLKKLSPAPSPSKTEDRWSFCYSFLDKPKETEAESLEELFAQHSRQRLYAPHHFEKTSFRKPTSCAHCSNFIFGLRKQGFSCRICRVPAHSRCYIALPPRCPGIRLKPKEKRRLMIERVFRKLCDDSHRSTISKAALQQLGLSEDQAKACMRRFDLNQDDVIDLDEFNSLVERVFIDSFRQFDDTGNGEITISELKEGFRNLGFQITTQQLLDHFTSMDTDNNGVVTLDEYIEACFVALILREIN